MHLKFGTEGKERVVVKSVVVSLRVPSRCYLGKLFLITVVISDLRQEADMLHVNGLNMLT